MKLLLTGAGGLLGTAIREAAERRGWPCTVLARPLSLDAAAGAALLARFAGHDVAIHAAANTNVEQCEVAPADCYRDNFLLTELIAGVAARAGVKPVFISSTGVYGSAQEHAYREYDQAVPTTHHHRSKLLAEQRVLASSHRSLVVRTGWLFGGASANPKNFVARRIDEARAALAEGRCLRSNAEQRGVPCYAVDIAERLLDLCQADASGTLNCVNSGMASRHDYVDAIVSLAGLGVEVKESDASVFERKAKVSNNEMAENWKMTELGWPPMPHWRESLAIYLNSLLGGAAPAQPQH